MATYLRPHTLQESLDLLASKPRQIIAGATDVYPGQVAQRTWGRPHGSGPSVSASVCDDWLDISAIDELGTVLETDDHWRIGALVTWSQLCEAALPSSFDGLKAAGREVGGLQIQNRGTLVGNLCNASPAADGVPPLLCLDAKVELRKKDAVRVLDLSQFLLGNRQTALQTDEMMSAILIPKTPSTQSKQSSAQFYKLGARRYLVISIVMASSLVTVGDDGRISDCRIAVGSCSAVAQRLSRLEESLLGCALDSDLAAMVARDQLSELSPIDDVRADAAYRLHAAEEAVKNLLRASSGMPV